MTPNDIVPSEGGIARCDESTFAATIELKPIDLPTDIPGEELKPEVTEIELEGFTLPSSKLSELRNQKISETAFTDSEGSVCLQAEHHPVRILGIEFGEIYGSEIEATFHLEFDFYFCDPPEFEKAIKLNVDIED